MLKRIITVTSVVMFGTMLVTGYILYGNLKNQVIESAGYYTGTSVQQVDNLLEGVTSVTNIISTDRNLHSIFANYYKYPKLANQYREQINLRLNEISYINPNVRSIVFVTSKQDVFATTSAFLSDDTSALKSDWYGALKKDSYYSYFSIPFAGKESLSQKPVLDSYYATYVHLTNGMEGSVLIKFDCSVLMTSTQAVPKGTGECMWLTGSDQAIYPAKAVIPGNLVSNSVVETKNGIYSIAVSDKSMWKMVCYTSTPVIWESIKGPILMQFGSILFLTFVIILVMLALLINIVRPINMLSQTMSSIADGNFDVQSEIRTGDEVENLSNIFNFMTRQIKKHIDQEIEYEKSKQHMEYSLLISQIDPHFIYNTMNTINYLARKGRCSDVISVNSALIKIMQDRLRVSKIEIFDTVEQEVDMVNQYFLIQQYRYSNRIRLKWNVDPSALSLMIPKNIMQPLVENSYYHGFMSDDQDKAEGVISISIISRDEHIIIIVADNGTGMDEKHLSALKDASPSEDERGRHIGVRNIRERLAFLYQSDDCMTFESQVGKGTRITVTLEKRKTKAGE
jgi:two-component system, sensor histidine kinase YesM